MQTEFIINTKRKQEIIDITEKVKEIIIDYKTKNKENKSKEGICVVYVPHATAAITINENYDRNLCLDFIDALNKLIPQGIWRHDKIDNNGAAHIKSAIIGPSITIPIKDSELLLGRWQGIMLCEFDGPRQRKVIIEIMTK